MTRNIRSNGAPPENEGEGGVDRQLLQRLVNEMRDLRRQNQDLQTTVQNMNRDRQEGEQELRELRELNQTLQHRMTAIDHGQSVQGGEGQGVPSKVDRRTTRYNPYNGRPGGSRPTYAEPRRVVWNADDYTPLNAKRSEILKEVYNANLLDPPLPARGPKGPYKHRWCEFHRVQGHDTEECWDLMNQIERLIKDGYLRRYVAREGRRPTNEGQRRNNSARNRADNKDGKRGDPPE
ncbi:hypothetical protein SESBI_02542 [Sesbania bispinosa]|nr:hypothetical protein SESBI_02542 [Sesbania bispinosa]